LGRYWEFKGSNRSETDKGGKAREDRELSAIDRTLDFEVEARCLGYESSKRQEKGEGIR
jgi:hypothetical protein